MPGAARPSATVSIGLLGQFRITAGGVAIPFRAPPRTLALLGYLAIKRSRPSPRDALAFTLWPDVDEETARANLRRHLHYLNRALPATDEPWTLGDKRIVQWNPKHARAFDIAEFEELQTQAGTRARAVDLYAGDLLEDLDEEWIGYERERLRTMHLSALETLIAESAAAADATRTVFFARRLLQSDPWREDALRALMVARHKMGDRAGALAEYERFAGAVKQELGVDPMPETVACMKAIVLQAPPRPVAASHVEVQKSPAPVETLPLAGRAHELERLRILWSRTCRGRGACVLIGGEAGIGKTRLTQELAEEARRDGFVAVGHSSTNEFMPFHGLADALRTLPSQEIHLEPLWKGVLAPLLPHFRKTAATVPKLSPEDEQARILEAFSRYVASLSTARPLLLILEDLHWAGAAIMAAIEFLARHIAERRILLIGTYREEEIGLTHPLRSLRRSLRRDDAHAHLALSALAPDAVQMLVRLISGLGPEANPFAERLFSVTEGNPLFLVESLRDALEAGFVVAGPERWEIRDVPRDAPRGGAKTAILDRLGRLSSHAYSVAEVGAVIGRHFDLELVTEVSGWSEADVTRAVDELLDRHILRDSGTRTQSEYAFSHHLIQSAVYDGVAAKTLVQRHRRTAAVLESLAGGEVAGVAGEIAEHYRRGGELVRAAAFYAMAAERAASLGGNQEASLLAARGLELTSEDALRLRLLMVRAEAARRELRRDEQRSYLDELVVIAERTNDHDMLCRIRVLRIAFFNESEDHEREEHEIALLEMEAERTNSVRWFAEAVLARIDLAIVRSAWEQARSDAVMLEAREGLRAYADLALRLLLAKAILNYRQGRRAEGDAAMDEARRFNVDVDYPLRVRLLHSEIEAARLTIDWIRVRQAAQELIELAASAGDRAEVAYGHAWCGPACTELYEVAEGRRHLEMATALYGELGRTRYSVQNLESLTCWAALFGSPQEAVSYAARCEELAQNIGYDLGAAIGALNLSSALAMQARFAEAKGAATRAVDGATRLGHPFALGTAYGALGTAERGLGELANALLHHEHAVEIQRRILSVDTLGDDLVELVLTSALAGKVDRMRAFADEALELYAKHAARVARPQVFLWVAALALHVLGEEARSKELVLQARGIVADKAALIADEAARGSYLRFPKNADIIEAADHDRWPCSLEATPA
ncbi:MAG: AAA family ATPase [Candidatus Eremiobacteraeota bacterium]|nr:AAA family ATPase [Candidatus Eremiobacteraeota bacterium]